MPKSERDIALEACHDAFKDWVHKAAGVLTDGFIVAGTDDVKKTAAKDHFLAGLTAAKASREAALQLVNQVLPNT